MAQLSHFGFLSVFKINHSSFHFSQQTLRNGQRNQTKQKKRFMRAYFKIRTCISLCGPEFNVNETHISKVNNVKSPRTFCVCSQHKSKYFAGNSQLINSLLLRQNV